MKNYNDKPICKIRKGRTFTAIQLGNIINRTLKAYGYVEQSREFLDRFLDCNDSDEGWKIIAEYVTVEKI